MHTELNPVERIPEILAPAGGPEQFLAALYSGADAVYLGLEKFNARARATNFTAETLRSYLPLARHYGMKVLITLNILIKEAELEELIETLALLEELEVDALIVQDLGVASICRRYFPSLRLHASTQMAVHNLEGVRAAAKLGFKRVVLARELTALEIKKIRTAVPRSEIEIEAFCHGSLCYSYSGLCFFSGAEDARSGNRGECAYTCRKPYKIVSEPGEGFLFSMKDLNTLQSLETLVATGVDTLKIEGRKKDAQYVSAVVRAYRKRLDEVFGYPTLRHTAPAIASQAFGSRTDKKAAQSDLPAQGDFANALSFSFRRDETSLFLKGRYHENVIDLENPGHKGLLIGHVEKVTPPFIVFKTTAALQQFDGIRIDSNIKGHAAQVNRYENQNCQFSLREFYSLSSAHRGKLEPKTNGSTHQKMLKVFEAQAGESIKIKLPTDLEHYFEILKRGDAIYKTRSNLLKQNTEKLSQLHGNDKLIPIKKFDLRIAAARVFQDGNTFLRLSFEAKKFDHVFYSFEKMLPFMQKENGLSCLEADLEHIFSTFGNFGFECGKPIVVSQDNETKATLAKAFLPRSELKQIKREFGASLSEAYQRLITDRLQVRKKQLLKVEPLQLTRSSKKQTGLAIKIDRIEYLAALEMALASASGTGMLWDTLVFEPKRAFLNSHSPAQVATELKQFTARHGIKLRLALPTVIRQWDQPMLRVWIKAFVENEVSGFEVGNLGALMLLEHMGLSPAQGQEISADFSLFALNSMASSELAELGISQVALSVEDDFSNMKAHLLNWKRNTPQNKLHFVFAEPEVILFKDTPLFIAESCSLTALHNGCPGNKVCGYRTLEIEDERGDRYFVAHESCKSIVYDKKAYSIVHHAQKLVAAGVSRFRIDFLTRPYTPAQISEVLAATAIALGASETNVHLGLKDPSREVPQSIADTPALQALRHTHSANFERMLL